MKIPTILKLKLPRKSVRKGRIYHDFIKIVFCVFICGLVLILFMYDVLEKFEFTTFDHRLKLRRRIEGSDKIIFVDIAEDSINKTGRWPWPREWHASMIMVLSALGVEAITFDVLFSEPSSESDDALMEEAIKKSGNVYVPFAFEFEEYDEQEKEWKIGNVIAPLERFAEFSNGKSHISIMPDLDGTIRRIPLIINYNGENYSQLGLKVASDVRGIDVSQYSVKETLFGRYMNIGLENEKTLSIPVDNKNQMLINWVAKWGEGFKHYSFVEVLASYQDMLEGKEPSIDLSEFKGKICLIGLTAAGLYDIKPTPLQPAYPAVGTHANIMNSVLTEDFIKKAPRWIDALIILILGLFLSKNIYRFQPVRGLSIAVLMITAYLLFSFVILELMKTWISVIYPIITIIAVYLTATFYDQMIVNKERAKLFKLATRDSLTDLCVRRHFNLLLEAEMKVTRAGEEQLSILMLDIDYFKKVNDTYGHQTGDFILKEVAKVLKSSCRPVDVIARYGGEEFIIMLPATNINGATLVAERIRKRVEEGDFKLKDKVHKVTISLGIALFKKEDAQEDIVKRADEALYKAKDRGRNRVATFVSMEQI